jgi:hypothetical protein
MFTVFLRQRSQHLGQAFEPLLALAQVRLDLFP